MQYTSGAVAMGFWFMAKGLSKPRSICVVAVANRASITSHFGTTMIKEPCSRSYQRFNEGAGALA
jgi:hypothetical protein